ncbi:MAG: vitamin K epoxide reductase family protein [Chitinophagaceae bacterium]|nr:vitamin K epoxide reductase family protein [Chitinophagaceae bacterium]
MKTCIEFLKYMGVPFNKQTVINFFETHAYHPSVLSISDLLDEFNVENAAVRINKENFCKIPAPFIAKTQSSDGDYCLVTALSSTSITYQTERGKQRTERLEVFFLQYSGVVLVAEKNNNSGEPNYQANRIKYNQKKGVLILAFTIVIGISFIAVVSKMNTPYSVVMYFVKTLGVAVSILLVFQSFNLNNPFVNKLCSSASGNGCENILNSPAAKIFNGKLSWSEVGLFYFLSTFLAITASPTYKMLLIIAIVNCFSLPYTIYSIYYQYKIAGQWCKLCLSVQMLLWCELIVSLLAFRGRVIFESSSLIILFYSLLLVVIIWYLLKPLITRSLLVTKLQRDINQFKKDENIFNTLLSQQKSVTALQEESVVVFGNPEANFEITFVSNPYCRPCASMHKKLDLLLQDEASNLRLNIIFAVSAKEDDAKNKIIAILINLYCLQGSVAAKNAMKEWYNGGYEKENYWVNKYQLKQKPLLTSRIMEAHRLWCDENDITHTPALFLNKYPYLTEYSYEDLKQFIRLSANKNV